MCRFTFALLHLSSVFHWHRSDVSTPSCCSWFVAVTAWHSIAKIGLYNLCLSWARWWSGVYDLSLLGDLSHSSCESQLSASSYGWSQSQGWRTPNRWTELSLRRGLHLAPGVRFDACTKLELPLVVDLRCCSMMPDKQISIAVNRIINLSSISEL